MQNKLSIQKFQILSGSTLKLIAVIAMLIDHAALVLRPLIPFLSVPLLSIMGKELMLYELMRKVGRLAFPIYCFLISEGFAHTRNKTRYAFRLLIFAFISELPFNLMLSGRLFYTSSQNVFLTLFLGVVLLYIFEYVNGNLRKAVLMFAVIVAAQLLQTDYGVAGVALILLIYILRAPCRTGSTCLSPALRRYSCSVCLSSHQFV